MNLKVAVVDDEYYMLYSLVELLQNSGVKVVKAFLDPEEFLSWSKDNCQHLDAVFLDICMPVLDGFDVADVLCKLDDSLPVVFVTAYDEYAVAAFEKAALDYILKPAGDERLNKALLRIQSFKESRLNRANSSAESNGEIRLSILKRDELWEKKQLRLALYSQFAEREHKDKLLLFKDGNWEWIQKQDISSFSMSKKEKYVQVQVRDETYEAVEKSIAEFLQYFDGRCWMSCFRAVYVNVEHIEQVERQDGSGNVHLRMKGSKKKIAVSRNRLQALMTQFTHLNRKT